MGDEAASAGVVAGGGGGDGRLECVGMGHVQREEEGSAGGGDGRQG